MALIFDASHLLDLVSLVRASCIACQEQEGPGELRLTCIGRTSKIVRFSIPDLSSILCVFCLFAQLGDGPSPQEAARAVPLRGWCPTTIRCDQMLDPDRIGG